jgi:FkbM family methyltransferase
MNNVSKLHASACSKDRWQRLACAVFLPGACIALARSFGRGAILPPARGHSLGSDSTASRVTLSRLADVNAVTAVDKAAYDRQRKAGDRLLERMRAAQDAWEQGYYHRPTRAVWVDPFRDFYRCPAGLEKVGALSDGGKWVCGVENLLQRPGCVIYAVGSNGDASFEKAMLEKTKCSVWTFDPTLNDEAQARVNSVPGLNFTAVGLADKDGDVEVMGAVRPVRTLETLMRERGHTWVDLFKMDIEGGEWAVLDGLIKRGGRPPITQAQIECHVANPVDAVETLAELTGLGWRVFHVEENNYCTLARCHGKLYEISFASTDDEGQVVTGP